MRTITAALFLVWCSFSFAFPELVRHGYSRCTVCHVSPNGGGLTTPYGRALSGELLSTWSKENEANVLYDAVTLPEWLNLGGDFRYVQTFEETPTVSQARSLIMQADLEASVSLKKWTAVATVGTQYGATLLSRRHYLVYNPHANLFIRAGKFRRAYGIEMPNHVFEIKRGLVFDQGTETYNVELSWFADPFELFITTNGGRLDSPILDVEQGLILRPAINLFERHKIGFSYYFGSNSVGERHLFGPYAMLGFSESFFVLAELDFQKRIQTTAPSTFGMVGLLKADYELVQGLHVFGAYEFAQLDFDAGSTRRNRYTAGVQWFPRPHFEIEAAYQRQVIDRIAGKNADWLWLTGHFYL